MGPAHDAEEALHAGPALVREVSCAPYKLLICQSPTASRSFLAWPHCLLPLWHDGRCEPCCSWDVQAQGVDGAHR